MGCNCKTNEQIGKLKKHYGYDVKMSFSESLKFNFNELLKLILIVIIVILFSPMIFIILLILFFCGKTTIDMNKILRFLLKKSNNE